MNTRTYDNLARLAHAAIWLAATTILAMAVLASTGCKEKPVPLAKLVPHTTVIYEPTPALPPSVLKIPTNWDIWWSAHQKTCAECSGPPDHPMCMEAFTRFQDEHRFSLDRPDAPKSRAKLACGCTLETKTGHITKPSTADAPADPQEAVTPAVSEVEPLSNAYKLEHNPACDCGTDCQCIGVCACGLRVKRDGQELVIVKGKLELAGAPYRVNGFWFTADGSRVYMSINGGRPAWYEWAALSDEYQRKIAGEQFIPMTGMDVLNNFNGSQCGPGGCGTQRRGLLGRR